MVETKRDRICKLGNFTVKIRRFEIHVDISGCVKLFFSFMTDVPHVTA